MQAAAVHRAAAYNNSFKPNPLRYTNNMAGRACHVVASTTRVGLTQALGPEGQIRRAEAKEPAGRMLRKQCSVCGVVQPQSAFRVNRRSPPRLHSYCRECEWIDRTLHRQEGLWRARIWRQEMRATWR